MARRILVLAVDRDDDLGSVGIRTPVVGREKVLEAAVRFALARPEDSDANVLFASVKLVDELRRKGVDAEVAVVSGHPVDSIEADMRIREQTKRIVEATGATEAILVSDGSEDELVLPVIQGVVPVASVKRIIVEQHRGIEETYILLARYIRKAVEEPRFARLFLGVPGLVLIVFSSLALLGYLWHAILLGLLVAGTAMAVRGFGLEDRVVSLFTRTPIPAIAYVLSGIVAVTGIGVIAYYASTAPLTLATLGHAVRTSTTFFTLAASIAIVSHALHKLLSGNVRFSREVSTLTIVLVLASLLNTLATAMEEAGSAGGEGVDEAALLVSRMLDANFTLQAIGGVIVIALVWRVSVYIEDMIASEQRESSEQEAAERRVSGRTSSP